MAWMPHFMLFGPLPGRQPDVVERAGLSLPDALDSGFHCVRAHWIRGFIAFQLARRAGTVMLMVPV
jgi:hypothetical protein